MTAFDQPRAGMQKLRAQITYCDPPTRRIEGLIKGGAVVQIAVWELPIAFRWPVENEIWTINYSNGYWHLGHKLDYPEQPDVTTDVKDMDPGDTRISTGGRITLDGDVFVNGRLTASSGQIDGAGGGTGDFYYQNTAPSGASVGDRWMHSATGRLYVYIKGQNSTVWVEP